MAKKSSLTKTAVWILMGLLFLGLGGFGAANLGGTIRSIGTVGDKSLSVDQYARQLQNEIQAFSQQTGQQLTFARAQELGIDRAVLQRVVRDRALDHETSQLGLSIGDEALRTRVLEIPAFQGIDGAFDREAYGQTLRRSGLTEGEFEQTLREEAARNLVQAAIFNGVRMPKIYTDTLVSYATQKRSFTWTALTAEDLDPPVAAPTDAELTAYFEDNGALFVLPETKKITYVLLSPDAVLDEIEIDEDLLRQEYEARNDTYNQPERRLIERLVFSDAEAADQAAAALEVGGTTFEALVEDRGLELSDVDLGDVGRAELGEAGDGVFDAEAGDVVGPLPSSLGPALFRVNAVLPAMSTSFDEARAELRDILASDRAVRMVESLALDIDDQLAGGATLEQLAEQTDMELGAIDWTPQSSEDIAAYADFREAAAALTSDDFPQIAQLEDGSVFAMRLDEELPARPAPLDAVREDVVASWRNEQIVARLSDEADIALAALKGGASFGDAGLDATIEADMVRSAFVEGTPPAMMAAVFEMEPGEARTVPGEDSVVIVQLDEIDEGADDARTQSLSEQLGARQNQALAQGLFNIFTDDVVSRAGTQIDPNALQAVHVNFP